MSRINLITFGKERRIYRKEAVRFFLLFGNHRFNVIVNLFKKFAAGLSFDVYHYEKINTIIFDHSSYPLVESSPQGWLIFSVRSI